MQKKDSNLIYNRCPKCQIGYLYCKYNDKYNLWQENCSDCNYVRLRKDLRHMIKRTYFDRRKLKAIAQHLINIFRRR